MGSGDAVSGPGTHAQGNKDYSFTGVSSIPLSLQACSVEKCSLEFMSYADPINHCMTRLTFKHVQVDANEWAPAGTRGVLIDCQFVPIGIWTSKDDIPEGVAHPSRVRVQTFTYVGPHRGAVKVVDIPVKNGPDNKHDWKVCDFLRTIEEAEMSPAAFTHDVGERVNGCRDWTSQLIHRWNLGNIVELSGNWGECFNFVYRRDDEKIPRPVKQAAFVAGYERLVVPGVNYIKDYDPRLDPQLVSERMLQDMDTFYGDE